MKSKLLSLTVLTIILIPTIALADGYVNLVSFPGPDGDKLFNPDDDFSAYINTLYALSISIAALLAVIKIVIAGVKWMMSDVVTTKSEAKKDIYGALIGLVIVLSAVLVLTVINPKLVDVQLAFPKQNQPGLASNGEPEELDPTLLIHYSSSDGILKTVSKAQIDAFRESCSHPKTFTTHALSDDWRCFDTLESESVTYAAYCMPGTPGEVCDKTKETFKLDCESHVGIFTDEPSSKDGTRLYSCVRDRF